MSKRRTPPRAEHNETREGKQPESAGLHENQNPCLSPLREKGAGIHHYQPCNAHRAGRGEQRVSPAEWIAGIQSRQVAKTQGAEQDENGERDNEHLCGRYPVPQVSRRQAPPARKPSLDHVACRAASTSSSPAEAFHPAAASL